MNEMVPMVLLVAGAIIAFLVSEAVRDLERQADFFDEIME